MKKEILVVILVGTVLFVSGCVTKEYCEEKGMYYFDGKCYPVDNINSDALMNLCLNTGGAIGSGSCCGSVGDFPDSCLVGACGCSPEYSHEVKTCNCPQGMCFDQNRGCKIREQVVTTTTLPIYYGQMWIDYLKEKCATYSCQGYNYYIHVNCAEGHKENLTNTLDVNLPEQEWDRFVRWKISTVSIFKCSIIDSNSTFVSIECIGSCDGGSGGFGGPLDIYYR